MHVKTTLFLLLSSVSILNQAMQHTVAQESTQDTTQNNNNNLDDFFAETDTEEMPIPEIKKLNWLEKYFCAFAIKIVLTYGLVRDSLQAWYNSLRTKK